MARADSGMPLTAEARVQIRTKLCGSCGKSSTGIDFSPKTCVSPVSIIMPILHSYIHIIYTLK
jgi:hypothetical protein